MFEALNASWDKDDIIADGKYTALVESIVENKSKGGAVGLKITLKLFDVSNKAFIDYWLINKDSSINVMGKNELKKLMALLKPEIAEYKNPLTGNFDIQHSITMFLELAKKTPCIVEAKTEVKPSPDGTKEFRNTRWEIISFETLPF